MRLATWNMKQAIAPKKPLDELWEWIDTDIQPDVIALTEAKVPKSGMPTGWTGLWNSDGIYPEKRGGKWGTVLASKELSLVPVTSIKSAWRKKELKFTWPAAVEVADILVNEKCWGTMVGLYAPLRNKYHEETGNGEASLSILLEDLSALFNSDRGDRIVIAGDFNCWPQWISKIISHYGLVDLVEETAASREPLQRCSMCAEEQGIKKPDNTFIAKNCGHLWTHKNGNSENAKVQQIDFILSTKPLLSSLERVYGGSADFEDVWSVSDHAPLVAEFT